MQRNRTSLYKCSLNVNIRAWFELIDMNPHVCRLWCFLSHCGIPVGLQVVALVSCMLEIKYFDQMSETVMGPLCLGD